MFTDDTSLRKLYKEISQFERGEEKFLTKRTVSRSVRKPKASWPVSETWGKYNV